MYTQPRLKTASALRDEMRLLLRDPSSSTNRWSSNEYYYTLNKVLESWQQRVRLPALYTLTDGFTAGVFEYTLPNYIREPMRVELQRETSSLSMQAADSGDTSDFTWNEVGGWRLEPDGSGGQKLRMHSWPYSVDGRVIYYVANGPTPITEPTLSAEISSTAASLVADAAVDVSDVGWVKIDSEWIEYHGVARGSATTTLQTLLRGRAGTTAATHTSGTTVYWGVGVDAESLWGQLRDQWEIELNRMYLVHGADGERRRHQEQIMFLKGMVEDFWRTKYISQPSPKMNLGPRVLGL